MNPRRGVVLAAAAALFVYIIAQQEDPVMMLVGLLPLAWIAFEGLWRLLGARGETRASGIQAARRTGIRREPKGLSNFP